MEISSGRAPVDPQGAYALVVEGLCVDLGGQPVLSSVNLTLPAATTVAVTGPSGAGKSTLLNALGGLQPAAHGRVVVAGRVLNRLSDDERAELRLREVGFVLQSSGLVPELSLQENIALPLELAGMRRRGVRDRVAEVVAQLGLTTCARRRPSEVSGGQAQRAAVARAVAARPSVVLADEPTGALDSTNREIVLDLLLEQVERCGSLLVLVTHDPQVAARCARQVRIVDGRVAAGVGAAGG